MKRKFSNSVLQINEICTPNNLFHLHHLLSKLLMNESDYKGKQTNTGTKNNQGKTHLILLLLSENLTEIAF